MTEISYGKKYEEGLNVTEIAKRVRKDIVAAIKAGELPKGLKVAVRVSRYSGGRSLDAEVKEVPEGFVIHNPERVRLQEEDPSMGSWDPHHHPVLTEEATKVYDTIGRLIAAYNYDGSDSMTDYFNVNFYSNISWDSRVDRLDRERTLAKLAGKPEPDEPLEFGPEAVVAHLTQATHWTNWSASEVARDLHVGVDRARTALDAMANGNMLFKTWSHQRQAIIYRLPKEGDTPERNMEHREAADKKAAETKEARAARKAERKKAKAEYEERRAREDKETKKRAAREAKEKAERGAKEPEDDGLARRVRDKAAQLALEAQDKAKKVDLSGPAFYAKKIGFC